MQKTIKLPQLLFSKALQHLSVPDMAEKVKQAGFDGIDLTVRPGGHVLPENAGKDLPLAVAACRKAGAPAVMITTDIKTPDQPGAEAIFAAASEVGIQYLKLGYHKYVYGQYNESFDTMRRSADGFEKLARRYGICACHHIHSADFMTQSAFTVAQILDGHNPNYLGAYIDPCHMWIEGMLRNWLMGMEVLRGKIRLVAIKDFQYPTVSKRLSESFEYPPFVPLRQGAVSWQQVMRVLLEDEKYTGPLSFHAEYTHVAQEKLLEMAQDDRKYLTEYITGRSEKPVGRASRPPFLSQNSNFAVENFRLSDTPSN